MPTTAYDAELQRCPRATVGAPDDDIFGQTIQSALENIEYTPIAHSCAKETSQLGTGDLEYLVTDVLLDGAAGQSPRDWPVVVGAPVCLLIVVGDPYCCIVVSTNTNNNKPPLTLDCSSPTGGT